MELDDLRTDLDTLGNANSANELATINRLKAKNLAAFNALRGERDRLQVRLKERNARVDSLRRLHPTVVELRSRLAKADALARAVKSEREMCAAIWTDVDQRFKAGHVLTAEEHELLLTYVAMSSDVIETLAAYSEGGSSPLVEELEERRFADAELGGTNSCVDDGRLAKLFLKHRKIAQDLQQKWVAGNRDAVIDGGQDAEEEEDVEGTPGR